MSGTSMATPHVAGLAALIWSQNSDWTNKQVRARIRATAEDLGSSGWDQSFGYGRIDAASAMGVTGLPRPRTSGRAGGAAGGEHGDRHPGCLRSGRDTGQVPDRFHGRPGDEPGPPGSRRRAGAGTLDQIGVQRWAVTAGPGADYVGPAARFGGGSVCRVEL